MKRKILALFLALTVLFSALNGTAVLAQSSEDDGIVTVSFTAQAYNGFLCAPQTASKVNSDLAESYGYTDKITDGVSALDVLVKAHEIIFADSFTSETKDEILKINDSFITKVFGVETSNFGFALNGKAPHDNTLIESDWGDYYTGYSIDNLKVSDGDLVEFFIYQNSYATDNYIWFEKDDNRLSSLSVKKDSETVLKLKGYSIGWYGCNTEESILASTSEISGAQLCLVDLQTGAVNDINGSVSDENGNLAFTFNETGTFLLTAKIPDDEINNGAVPAVMPILPVTVESGESMSDADAVKLIYDEFSSSGENKYNSASNTPLEFPLEYEGSTYTNLISYIKAWSLKETGREVNVQYDSALPTTSYADWTSGDMVKYVPTAFNENGEITQNYYADNSAMSQRIANVSFTVGDVTSEKITRGIYAKVTSLHRSSEEIVNYVADNLPFARICGKNESEDKIVQGLGEGTSSLSLPTADKLYTKKSAVISWSLIPQIEGDTALTLSNNKISVLRPNVGESDSKFTLKATVTSASDENVSQEVNYNLTVPAFEEVIVPIQVTKGASLVITDNYYKKETDVRYIVKQENAPEGYDLYYCSLHGSAEGGRQAFGYCAKKDGYITSSGSFNVASGSEQKIEIIDLTVSSENDTKLKSLEIVSPTVKGFEFDPDVTEYNVEVSGAQYINLAGSAAVDGASAKITSYYKTAANANSGKLTTSGTGLTAGGVKCYLPDESGVITDIVVTVNAPEGSVQETKSKTYTLHVNKTGENYPLTGLVITASSSGKGIKNNKSVSAEETLAPSFVSGAREEEYYYTVNYFRDRITVKSTAPDCTITVNGKEVDSATESDIINLNVGDNTVVISVTKDGVPTDYKVIVHRKEELRITGVDVEGGALSTVLSADGSDWTGSCNFANSAERIFVTYHTNVTENVKIKVLFGDKTYEGVSGEPIEIYVGNEPYCIPTTQIIREIGSYTEDQGYVISFRRMPADSPSAVTSYLPAPGQFVNLDGYQSPEKTLSGSGMITLGAFGGNVVYKYDEPIMNDSANPYGIDFIIAGNCFANDDGSTSPSAAEPAAVMVSKDGETWYELAGSEYYNASTRRNIKITYTNGDTSFTEAADTAWTDSTGKSGIIPTNSFHNQPYYPNPAYYNQFQTGIGKNAEYSKDKVSFAGNMIETGFYPFGYADSHAQSAALGNKAVNPYAVNHYMNYNGDGFDLDWAVDENGNPVYLDEISYIKIYNPVLNCGGSAGEKSPEIVKVMRAEASSAEVGTSRGLAGLTINGKAISLEEGVYVYNADGEGASSLVITPASQNPDANIYVLNQRVVSGESTSGITAVSKVRILVQEDEKEPVIYIINLANVETVESNADLKELLLTPGDEAKTPDENNKIEFTVSGGISSVRLMPTTAGIGASAAISGGKLSDKICLSSGETSLPLMLDKGENSFTLEVTSSDGKNTKEYTVNIYRDDDTSSSGSSNLISVKFSMTGDKIHYDSKKGEYTGSHTNPVLIKSTTVTVPKGATVKYLTEMMLNNAGIDYTTDGVYISEIGGLSEFDNGPNSGWLYRYNGYIADEGYGARTLSAEDVVKWFYTDDYTLEKDYEGNFEHVNSSGSASKTNITEKTDSGEGVSKKAFVEFKSTVSDNTAVITDVTLPDISTKSDNTQVNTLSVDVSGKGDKISTVSISENSLLKITKAMNSSDKVENLEIKMPFATVSFNKTAVNEITSQIENGKFIFTAKKADESELNEKQRTALSSVINPYAVKLSTTDGNGNILNFGTGTATVNVPYEKAGENVRAVVWYAADDGMLEKMPSAYNSSDKTITFTTPHFSYYVIGTENSEDCPFEDISADKWYYDYVMTVYEKGLMTGVSDNEFAPYEDLTRAMFVTVLYRMENEPQTEKALFTDVADGAYYEKAVSWAYSNGIVNGVSNNEFAPDDKITREQMASVIYRYAGYKNLDTSVGTENVRCNDSGEISPYAKDAVIWSDVHAVMQGNTDGSFKPHSNASRAEAAAVFARLMNLNR